MKTFFKFFLIFLLFSPLWAGKSVAIIGLWPLPAVLAFGTDAQIIYMPKASSHAMQNSLALKFKDKFKNAKLGNAENLEELLALNADLYICGVSNIKTCQGLKNSGAKVLELTTNVNNHNSKDVLKHWLDGLSEHFDIKKQSEKILNEITRVENFIAERTKNAKKPQIAMIHRFDKNTMTSGIFNNYLITKSGGKNPWGYRASQNISLEELYKTNPDIIYISNFTPLMPEDLYKDKKWQFIKAVREKRVYKLPLASYRPYAPSYDLAPVLLFMASKNHPEIFSDISAREEYQKYFAKFFNINLNKKELDKIFNPSRAAGKLN